MKAVTVGSATLDIITLVNDEDVERMTLHNATSSFLLLEQGRKFDAISISTHVGGGAVNAAVAMSRLGLTVDALIKVGADLNGDKLLAHLEGEGIGTGLVRRTDEAETGIAVMISSHDRNATIFAYRGANTLLRPDEIAADAFKSAGLVYVTNLSNSSADCFPVVVRQARGDGAFVAANPGIRQLTSRTGPFFDSLAHIDLLTLNRVEAAQLVPALVLEIERQEGGHASLGQAGGAGDSLSPRPLAHGGVSLEMEEFMAAVRRLGPRYVVVTDGRDGAYAADEAGVHFCPAVACEVAGTAGAGDAYASTFASLVALGREVGWAMPFAALNAASVIGHVDTQTGLLGLAALEAQTAAAGLEVAFRPW